MCRLRRLGFFPDIPGPESYSNEQFYLGKDGTISSGISNFCVTQNGVGFSVYIGPCSGSASQQWVYDPQSGQIRSGGGCLTVGGPTGARSNIWGRPLADGSWAIAFINADEAPTDLTCASDCLRITGWEKNQVRRITTNTKFIRYLKSVICGPTKIFLNQMLNWESPLRT